MTIKRGFLPESSFSQHLLQAHFNIRPSVSKKHLSIEHSHRGSSALAGYPLDVLFIGKVSSPEQHPILYVEQSAKAVVLPEAGHLPQRRYAEISNLDSKIPHLKSPSGRGVTINKNSHCLLRTANLRRAGRQFCYTIAKQSCIKITTHSICAITSLLYDQR